MKSLTFTKKLSLDSEKAVTVALIKSEVIQLVRLPKITTFNKIENYYILAGRMKFSLEDITWCSAKFGKPADCPRLTFINMLLPRTKSNSFFDIVQLLSQVPTLNTLNVTLN